MNQNQHSGLEQFGADGQTASGTTTPINRTEREQWLEAYRRDAVAGMLQATAEAAVEGAEAELDTPLGPDPGTPERIRLDQRNATICAALREGYERHRAALGSAAPNPRAQATAATDSGLGGGA